MSAATNAVEKAQKEVRLRVLHERIEAWLEKGELLELEEEPTLKANGYPTGVLVLKITLKDIPEGALKEFHPHA